MFTVNQVVEGAKAGTFLILGFRSIGGEDGVQVKAVNPANHSEMGRGEMFLPLHAIKTI